MRAFLKWYFDLNNDGHTIEVIEETHFTRGKTSILINFIRCELNFGNEYDEHFKILVHVYPSSLTEQSYLCAVANLSSGLIHSCCAA